MKMFRDVALILDNYKKTIIPARQKLREIEKTYGEGNHFFLMLFAGTGDAFFSGMYIQDYARRNGIDHYVVLVIGGACKRVLALYPNVHVECISQEEAKQISHYKVFYETEKIHLLHYDTPIFKRNVFINGSLRGLNGLNFLDIFFRCCYGDVSALTKAEPAYDDDAAKIFIDKNRIDKKSIIISPYAKSMLTLLPEWFWEGIAEQLVKKGYSVYTNCGPNEKPVNYTKPIMFDFSISKLVMNRCGAYIGLRSGFTDIISMSSCKKIVLYPKHLKKGVGNSLACYSLVDLGLDKNAIELEFDEKLMKSTNDQLKEISLKILKIFDSEANDVYKGSFR